MELLESNAPSQHGDKERKLPGMLAGVRVIEFADATTEYCGLLLAGLGADVIKIEPLAGNSTRLSAPFWNDEKDPEKSLFFWNYNRGKQSVALELESETGRQAVLSLISGADVLLDSSCGRLGVAIGVSSDDMAKAYPSLIVARMTPFGDVGPWRNYKATDLIHLALGGIMMNCGYDPDPVNRYDLPPIAPQFWHAYHIAGDQLTVGIIAALLHRLKTGDGQDVSCAVHEAVSKNTELDVMSWVMRRAPLFRQTCRHAVETINRVPNISYTKDGRWLMTWGVGARDQAALVPFLGRFGMAADLKLAHGTEDTSARNIPGTTPSDEASIHVLEVIQRFTSSHTYRNLPWEQAQAAGLLWAPLRKPHENATDPHWLSRRTFEDIPYPEFGRSFRFATSKWTSTETAWQGIKRSPRLGEHTAEVLAEVARRSSVPATPRQPGGPVRSSPRQKPFALQNIRILDFSWFLASAGGTRLVSSLGAECIKVEWKGHPDTRLAAMAPVGGRAARLTATAPLEGVEDPNMGGQFNNKNSGKIGLSLNIKSAEGLEIAKRLVAISDVVAEGFSPGVLERLGLGYNVMKEVRPDIIYVQQSGMGCKGTYGRLRTVGPVAASFAGTNEMSGLPEPAMPAGWGYSFLDWMGAYSFAQAILGALYFRETTGLGQWIDASQCEAGIFLAGQATLDWSANGRSWRRSGNRSPNGSSAPHGAYPCRGEDRWIAIACTDEADWHALARAAEHPEWATDQRFNLLENRLANEDALDEMISDWTRSVDAYQCMQALQQCGVPAGVCQTAEDRCDRDPQLAELEWLTEVTGTKIGTWPVTEFPVKLSETPAHSGGLPNRGAPCYGEDNEYVLGELLGFSTRQILDFLRKGII